MEILNESILISNTYDFHRADNEIMSVRSSNQRCSVNSVPESLF